MLVTLSLTVLPGCSAQSTTPVDSSVQRACDDSGVVTSTVDAIADGSLSLLTFDDVPIDPPDIVDFSATPIEEPSFALYWRGLTWLMPLAASGDRAYEQLALDYVAAWQRTASSARSAGDPGWDEGTNLRRLKTLVCIARSVGTTPHLDAALEQSIAVAMDADRYPNIPFPNNHTVMINLGLIEAGDLLDRDDLVEFGLGRLSEDWPKVWTHAGFDREQSASYLSTNIRLWGRAREAFVMHGWTDDAAALASVLELARQNNALLVEPDGRVAAIGDGAPITPTASDLAIGGPRAVIDEEAGWAVGRSSWDADATHWTVRFGPPKVFHGHYDALSVTWSARGRSLLVDPGFYSYATATEPFAGWDHNPQAHNTVQPGVATPFDPDAGSALVGSQSTEEYERFDLSTTQWSIPLTRTIIIFRSVDALLVVDRGDTELVQNWHLDPALNVDGEPGGSGATWTDGDVELRVVTTAPVFARARGRNTTGIAGWVFPDFGAATPADQVTMVGSRAVATLWVAGEPLDPSIDVLGDRATVAIDGQEFHIPLE